MEIVNDYLIVTTSLIVYNLYILSTSLCFPTNSYFVVSILNHLSLRDEKGDSSFQFNYNKDF